MSNIDMTKVEKAPDPVHEFAGKWYFWDETWANRHGPYDTPAEAYEMLGTYITEHLACGP